MQRAPRWVKALFFVEAKAEEVKNLAAQMSDVAEKVAELSVTSTANAVSVDDPFPHAVEIDLVPVWDSAAVRTVFVDVGYIDPLSGNERTTRIQFDGGDRATRHLRIALRDKAARTFTWRATYVHADNHTTQRPTETTTETLITLTP
jgi:hypothetical protein